MTEDPKTTLAVLVEATHRLKVGAGVDMDSCVCAQRIEAETDTPDAPYPQAEGQIWCFLCAVESSQTAQSAHGDYFGYALSEVATTICGRRFDLFEFGDRDAVLFKYLDGHEHLTLPVFEATVGRLVA